MPLVDELGHKGLTISWSRLKEFEACHRKSYEHGNGSRGIVDGRIFLPGTLADRAMRAWLEQPDGSHKPGEMSEHVDRIFDEFLQRRKDIKNGLEVREIASTETAIDPRENKIVWRGKESADQLAVRTQARDAVEAIETFLLRNVLPFDYEPEFRFRQPLRIPDLEDRPRTIWLTGGMDIIVWRSDEDVRIYDLKVTKDDGYIRSTMGQLIFYPMVASAMFGLPLSAIGAAFLVPLAQTQFVPLSVGREDVRHLLSRIVECAHGKWRELKDVSEEDQPCWNCDVKQRCPKWNKPVTFVGNKMKVSLYQPKDE